MVKNFNTVYGKIEVKKNNQVLIVRGPGFVFQTEDLDFERLNSEKVEYLIEN